MRNPVLAAYGGGVNSTAMLVGMVAKKEPVDAVLFADTGGEKPETYDYVADFSLWLTRHGYPAIVVVRSSNKNGTLEQDCLAKGMLPSIAYGKRACSEKWKQRPQHKWTKAWQPAIDCWASGERVVKLIGYHADEVHRGDITGDGFYEYRYPMMRGEWNWGQERCLAEIIAAGLAPPPKSACFFCPSSKKKEVLALAQTHPDLFERAAAMEQAARPNLQTVKGLGRSYSWEGLVEADRRQLRLPFADQDIGCLCQGEVYGGEGIDADDDEETSDAD